MKNIKLFIILSVLLTFAFSSCDISLGSKLDIEGPVVSFTSPSPRASVKPDFLLEGKAQDFTGIKDFVITMQLNRDDRPTQWRYTGVWEKSDDYGKTWTSFSGVVWNAEEVKPEWIGTNKNAIWKIPVELPRELNAKGEYKAENGEYIFRIKATDTGGFSDDRSFKTLVLIIDGDPPIVEISNPFLHSRFITYNEGTDSFNDTELDRLHQIDGNGTLKKWEDPELIGSFQTNAFELQWNIDDQQNILAFDIRFYPVSVEIDEESDTFEPGYIYSYRQNLEYPSGDITDPNSFQKPTGKINVPILDSRTDSVSMLWDDDKNDFVKVNTQGTVYKKIDQKTTLRVVSICYDASENVTQEKTLGYFIYWKDADSPWITFSAEELKSPYEYSNTDFKKDVGDNAFKIYPGRDIKATVYHHQGVLNINYTLYKFIQTDLPNSYNFATDVETVPNEIVDGKTISYVNQTVGPIPRTKNVYPTSYQWNFSPLGRTGYYVLQSTPGTINNHSSQTKPVIFYVEDISFPNFPVNPTPSATRPLFENIKNAANNPSIDIEGIVDDASEVTSLTMVWINPESDNYGAMSQLEYFKDPKCDGWVTAGACTPGNVTNNSTSTTEGKNDNYPKDIDGNVIKETPNRLWKIKLGEPRKNHETERWEYGYKMNIPLSDLNILSGDDPQPLKSQVFLLRAENPRFKTKIILYAPMGDEILPEIKITSVNIPHQSGNKDLIPGGDFAQIDRFTNGNTITIYGTWSENSVHYLPFDKFLKDNFKIYINSDEYSKEVPKIQALGGLQFRPLGSTAAWSNTVTGYNTEGEWRVTATIGQAGITTDLLRDTLVINAQLEDSGGNISQNSASWLIKSDDLRFVRVSSDMPDQTYKAGDVIEFFLEFSKPVRLKTGRANPVLTMNIDGSNVTAAYRTSPAQNVQNTRQYFTYTVGSTDKYANNTGKWLDVTGISGYGSGTPWTTASYPLTWESGNPGTSALEEIRLTMNNAHCGHGTTGTEGANSYYLRRLPLKTNLSGCGHTASVHLMDDTMYTLGVGKNLGIDTAAPSINNNGVTTNTPAGHKALNAVINVDVAFNEHVKIDTLNPPILQMLLSGSSTPAVTVETTGVPSVSNNASTGFGTVSFSYVVKTGDSSKDNEIIVSGITGGITDLAGNPMTAFASANRKTLTGIYINTDKPGVPTFRVLSENNNTKIITNTTSSGTVSGESSSAVVELGNIYNTNNVSNPTIWFAIMPNGSGYQLAHLEYSVDVQVKNGSNVWVANPKTPSWKRIDSITGAPFVQNIPGTYNVWVRQIDKAGNISDISSRLSFTWDPGSLISRIDSTTSNGTYTKNSKRSDKINVTIYFRKNLTFTGTHTIYLNTTSASYPTSTPVPVTNNGTSNQLSFTYEVGDDDNTPSGTGRAMYLDVTSLNITARDSTNVIVSSFINEFTEKTSITDGSNTRLGQRKDILVATGPLTRATAAGAASNDTEPLIAAAGTVTANDEWTGTITLYFNRPVTKGNGDIVISQVKEDYRLPAVITNAQYSKYYSDDFSTFYTRGVNGFSNNAPDTSTKYVLNYAQDAQGTSVEPPDSRPAIAGISRLAYDFHEKEKVTISLNSQDVTVDGKALIISVSGTNALPVQGAEYTITIPANAVQDNLNFPWPSAEKSYNNRVQGINKPVIRIDKKVNQDIITPQAGSTTAPQFAADFSRLIQTTARFDCRTPGSTVRYNAAWYEHSQTASSLNAIGTSHTSTSTGINWRSDTAEANNMIGFATTGTGTDGGNTSTNLVKPVVATNADAAAITNWTTGVTTYNTFTGTGTANAGPHVSVGTEQGTDGNVSGYTWRVNARSRVTIGGTARNSDEAEEVAFRTVFTFELGNISTGSPGTPMQNGEQLWIRGGDAVSTSSTPGFPINWKDNYSNLSSSGSRAGVRLMRKDGANNLNGGSNTVRTQWRWVTWEINVRTYHDVICGRIFTSAAGTAPQPADALELWQYGPRGWRYPRGGWIADKDSYTLYPGKHRWIYVRGSITNWSPGGRINWTDQVDYRDASLTVSSGITMPAAP